jgi:hypothetical protein
VAWWWQFGPVVDGCCTLVDDGVAGTLEDAWAEGAGELAAFLVDGGSVGGGRVTP